MCVLLCTACFIFGIAYASVIIGLVVAAEHSTYGLKETQNGTNRNDVPISPQTCDITDRVANL